MTNSVVWRTTWRKAQIAKLLLADVFISQCLPLNPFVMKVSSKYVITEFCMDYNICFFLVLLKYSNILMTENYVLISLFHNTPSIVKKRKSSCQLWEVVSEANFHHVLCKGLEIWQFQISYCNSLKLIWSAWISTTSKFACTANAHFQYNLTSLYFNSDMTFMISYSGVFFLSDSDNCSASPKQQTIVRSESHSKSQNQRWNYFEKNNRLKTKICT